jgi:hypothetical protein
MRYRLILLRLVPAVLASVGLAGARPTSLVAQVLAIRAPLVPGQGSGLIVRLDTECLLVAPRHVVVPGPARIELTDRHGRSVVGSIIHQDPEESVDIALIRPEYPIQPVCEAWPEAEHVQAVLSENRSGHLIFAAPNGAERHLEVGIALPLRGSNISVWPRAESEQFHEGMSGAGLYIDGTLVGMLVEAPVRSRRGIVYPLDFIWSRIRPASTGAPSPWVRTPGMQVWVSRVVAVAGACPTPVIRANWEDGTSTVKTWCSGDWIVIDFESLLSAGKVQVGGFYCIWVEDREGRHRALRGFPSWEARTYFSDGESIGVRVNETDVVITERAFQALFNDRCRVPR